MLGAVNACGAVIRPELAHPTMIVSAVAVTMTQKHTIAVRFFIAVLLVRSLPFYSIS
jgi:hypothetical protein